MNGIAYFILRFWLFLLFFVISSPLGIPLALLVSYLDAHEKLKGLVALVALFALVYLAGLSWLANATAKHMAFENRKFAAALRFAFWDLRFRLSFLPVIGQWFTSNKNTRDTDEDTDA